MKRTAFLLLLIIVLACGARVSPQASESSAGVVRKPQAEEPAKPVQKRPFSFQDARHALNRFSFGPSPGDTERLMGIGFEHWLDRQLTRAPAQNAGLEAALAPYRSAFVPPRELVESWLGEDLWQGPKLNGKLNQRIKPFFKDHLARLALSEVTRHVLSEHQLEEVMLDFWCNHFNVFARKGLVRIFAGDYIERALRPHALGNFADLLLATARHPAMLVYLDNAQSRAETPHDGDPATRKQGLNENYARELLELHTLGLQGGYTQADVTDTARALTGWSIQREGPDALGFFFRKRAHDMAPKTILGEEFPAGGGEDEGVRLIGLLAKHPATARHLATKLCGRFVADSPTLGCVSLAEQAYRESNGDISNVLRAIAQSPDFWADSVRGNKLKTPLEFLVSALRALEARPDATTLLARELARLGEPLLEESVPTGYPDSEPDWSSSSGLLARMSLASSLGFGKAKGVRVELTKLAAASPAETELDVANRLLLGGLASSTTLEAAGAMLARVDAVEERQSLALALLLGSPDFQRR